MRTEQLVTMANEVAAFFARRRATPTRRRDVATHLRRYWDPRMRKQIIEYASRQGEDLAPLARAGIELLARRASTNASER